MANNSGSHQINIDFNAVVFDPTAFNKFIEANGIQFEHYKAVLCPLGMTDPDSGRHSHAHPDCSNGYLYKYAGTVAVAVSNNGAALSLQEVGLVDGSVLNGLFSSHYTDKPNETVVVQLFDKFYIKDCQFSVPNTQYFSAQVSGLNKMTYKVERVEYLVDSQGKEYGPDDYKIENGGIIFTGTKVPQFDATLNKPAVCAIRYQYTPHFYASRLLHEVRLTKKEDFKTGVRSTVRGNYGALLSREYYMYKKEQAQDPANNDPNQTMFAPDNSIFGAR